MSERFFNPRERIREKQSAREKDERDLAAGRVSAKDLQERNSLVHGLDVKNAKLETGKPLR